jgi:5-methylcytosine-specific restriction endonuclease McrA
MVELAWTYGMACVICGLGFERKRDITAEHMIPLRDGGTSDLDNLGPAHQRCNSGCTPCTD